VRQQVNLYQPLFRKQEKKFSSTAMLQAAGIILAGIVLLITWTQWQVFALKGEITRAEQQHAMASKRLRDVTQQFGGQKLATVSADEEIARLEQRIAAYQRVNELLSRGALGNTRGFSEYFAAFARQTLPGIWLTGFDIVGAAEQVTLQGRSNNAGTVPRFVQKLSSEPRLAGIEFHTFQISRPGKGDGAYVDFTLKTAGMNPPTRAP
jgi:hypothetical protein